MTQPIIAYGDYETYWDKDYTLKKLSPIEYIMGDRAEVQSLSLAIDKDPPVCAFGEDIPHLLDQVPWDRAMFVAHNGNEFDHLISAWIYGIKPKLWADTNVMARVVHRGRISTSLASLAKHYGLPDKGDLLAVGTQGRYLADFSDDERSRMAEYNDHDTWLLRELFYRLLPQVTPRVMKITDITVRMAAEPKFLCDLGALRKAKVDIAKDFEVQLGELAERVDIASAEALRKILRSPAKFAKLLQRINAPVPMKWSETQQKRIPALAKTDKGLDDLLNHERQLVRDVAQARRDANSSYLEARIDRFIQAGELCGGRMPIMLRPFGAITERFQGYANLNHQNLTRVNPKEPKHSDVLRKSLVAPEGKQVVVADFSQIEMRVNHFLWREPETMAAYQADREADLYSIFAASSLYHCSVDEIKADKPRRQRGKIAQLQLGYGSGHVKFRESARQQGVVLSEDEAKGIVDAWRGTYRNIVNGWARLHRALPYIAVGEEPEYVPNEADPYAIDDLGLVKAGHEKLVLPQGLVLHYPELRREEERDKYGRAQWVYGHGKDTRKLYGAMTDENCSQALAGLIMTEKVVEFAQTELGRRYPLAHTVHDEIVYVVDNDDADRVLAELLHLMIQPPTWWPELILAAEGSVAQTYGDAK